MNELWAPLSELRDDYRNRNIVLEIKHDRLISPKINDLTHSLTPSDVLCVYTHTYRASEYTMRVCMINTHLLTIYTFEAVEWVSMSCQQTNVRN